MTDTTKATNETKGAGFLTGQKLDEREGLVGNTTDHQPGFDHLSGDESVPARERRDMNPAREDEQRTRRGA
jgi:hypothetical protein